MGIKGYSPLSWLDEFDVVKQTPIDYMHCVLLGVTKMLLNLWFNGRNKTNPYYIGHHTGLIDERLSSIFPPTEISRKPGLISKMSDWKGKCSLCCSFTLLTYDCYCYIQHLSTGHFCCITWSLY